MTYLGCDGQFVINCSTGVCWNAKKSTRSRSVSPRRLPIIHHGRRLRRASSEKKAVRPPSGYPYDPSGYGACFGAKWRLPGRAGAGRCRRTPEQGWG
eukprot:COSAG01_NODE_311_length_19072_cov_73.511727_8_plen_97_part_00